VFDRPGLGEVYGRYVRGLMITSMLCTTAVTETGRGHVGIGGRTAFQRKGRAMAPVTKQHQNPSDLPQHADD
jgi:hypothetical protein